MTSISSIPTLRPLTGYPAAAAARAESPTPSPASPSAIVQLSPEALAAAREDAAEPKPAPSTASRYRDIGAALLERFRGGTVAPSRRQELPDHLDNRFTLSIVTDSGKKVDLALGNAGEQMVVQVDADEDLGEEERAAVAGLAKGFQDMIDGMALDRPQIRLSGLAGFDSRLLRSIDLHAEVALPGGGSDTQKLDVHLDAAQRKVAIDGPSGRIEVGVDAGKVETLGTRQQQARAVDSYLKQFDQAAARGHADRELMGMFKDAFSAMSMTSTREQLDDRGITEGGRWNLSKEDHSVLTGLADFSASVSQTPQWSNPLRHDEIDGFEYTASQATRSGGASRADRAIAQTQEARLSAKFHEPLKDDEVLKLDVAPEAQNYDYHEIDDAASSLVELGYKDGRLRKARMAQSVSQSERIRKYVLGKLQSDRTLPERTQLVRDLLASLAPYQTGQELEPGLDTREKREERRQLSLDALSDNICLLGTRLELEGRRLAL